MKSRLSLALLGAALAAAPVTVPAAHAAEVRPGLEPCRLQGVEHDAWCGSVRRPLDPTRPQGLQIDVHYAVLPALARNRKADPVLFFAGGPGQSAIDLAGPMGRALARLKYRRDLVFIDQRGTGRSAALRCDEPAPTQPLAETADPARMVARLQACRERLAQLPHGDLRQYTTPLAMQDADAVRQALGAAQINLIGGSYGTRAALEYMRQFPQAVRRAVLDGVAPPDMAMPAAFSLDNQAAWDGLLAACEADPICRSRYPALRADWLALLGSLPRTANVTHPLTGAPERLTLNRELVLGLVRQPLYMPALAAALPLAVTEATRGRYEPLLGLSAALAGGRTGQLAEGMHFSVVCAEDLPRLAQAADPPGRDFGDGYARQYGEICAGWPRGTVPAAYYAVPPARAATLLLSGGADPVTPPRHGERVARALGALARHVVVAQAGHGVMGLACMRDVLFHFIDAASDGEALRVDAGCAQAIPRATVYVPLAADTAGPPKVAK
jgi:pimeloyl-ACP methyl ester carboxylesterase